MKKKLNAYFWTIFFVTRESRGQFHQTWAHSIKRKSSEVEQHNKLVNFFSTDDLTVYFVVLCSAHVKAVRKHVGEIDPSSFTSVRTKILIFCKIKKTAFTFMRSPDSRRPPPPSSFYGFSHNNNNNDDDETCPKWTL